MKKVLFVLMMLFGVFGFSFVNGLSGGTDGTGTIRIGSGIISNTTNTFVGINTGALEENKELQNKIAKFDTGFENYLKTISESSKQSDEKGDAYNEALNNLKIWVSIFGGILIIIISGLGWYKDGQITDTRREILKEITAYKTDLSTYKNELINEAKEYRNYMQGIDKLLVGPMVLNLFNEKKDGIVTDIETFIGTTIYDKLLVQISDELTKSQKDNIREMFDAEYIKMLNKAEKESEKIKEESEKDYDTP